MESSFVIPYVDQEAQFWETISNLYKPYIKEVYFPIVDEIIGTGRPKQPEKHLLDFLESKILPVSVLLNPIILPECVENLEGYIIAKLEDYMTSFNLVGISVSNPILAKKIKNEFPELTITASTLLDISNEQQLNMIDDIFDVIVPSGRILRDIRALRKLKSNFRGKLRLLVNESCLPSCVYRTQHFYEMSIHGNPYPKSLCNDLLKEKQWLSLTGGWILPQHLDFFKDVYDELKLAGRISLQNPARYFKVLGSYIDRKNLKPHEIGGGPASVAVPIEIDSDFYRHTLYCEKNCKTCSICEDYWNRMV